MAKSETYPVYIMRRYWNGLSHVIDWPKAHLNLEFTTSIINLRAPRAFPVQSLPITLSADKVQDIQIVSIGDMAIRFILFVVLLGIPYSITRWIRGGTWEIVISAAFIVGDFIVTATINRWLTIPAIRIVGVDVNGAEQDIHLMGQGWKSPLLTRQIAQRLTDLLVVNGYHGLIPPIGDEQHWRRIRSRMIAMLGFSTLILIITGVSMFLSAVLTGY